MVEGMAGEMVGFAEVRFKGTRKEYFSYENLDLTPGEQVIVEADRGEDLGKISALGTIAERKCGSSGGCATPLPDKRVLRFAELDDTLKLDELRDDENRVRTTARQLVERHELKMKITEAEWQALQSGWLPTGEDQAFVGSLMNRVTEPGKIAAWIAPPVRGINGKPWDFQYVRFN